MSTSGPANTHRQQIIEIVRERGLLHLPEPVVLASGELSRDFIDAKAALSRGADLKVACEAILENFGGDVPEVLQGYGAPARVTK